MKKMLSFLPFFLLIANLFAQEQPSTVVETYYIKSVPFNMVKITGGQFWMGAQNIDSLEINYDPDAKSDEYPIVLMSIPDSYYLGETEVTQELWVAVMGYNPCSKVGKQLPVVNVSWNEIQIFLKKLNELTETQNSYKDKNVYVVKTFRLPTEIEWEYAARGGIKNENFLYSGSNEIKEVAWYGRNSRKLKRVARKQPNALGLYDMTGNAWEWCNNPYFFYDENRKFSPPPKPMYAIRGGCYAFTARDCRVSWRGKRFADSPINFGGFRLCLEVKTTRRH